MSDDETFSVMSLPTKKNPNPMFGIPVTLERARGVRDGPNGEMPRVVIEIRDRETLDRLEELLFHGIDYELQREFELRQEAKRSRAKRA